MFVTVTDKDNIDEQWSCSKFVTFQGYLYNTVRVFVTVTMRTFGLEKDDGSLYSTVLGWLAYDDNRLPPNWGGCMIMYSTPIWIGIDILMVLYVFVSTQTLGMILAHTNTKSDALALHHHILAIEHSVKSDTSRNPVN
jgi:hypothetical protein